MQTVAQYAFSDGKNRPTFSDFAKNAYSFAVVGGVLSAGQPLTGAAGKRESDVPAKPLDQPIDVPAKLGFWVEPPQKPDMMMHEQSNHFDYNGPGPESNFGIHYHAATDWIDSFEPSKNGSAMADISTVMKKSFNQYYSLKKFSTPMDNEAAAMAWHQEVKAEANNTKIVDTDALSRLFSTLPSPYEFKFELDGRRVGQLPEPLLEGGLKPQEAFLQLDRLAKVLRNLDACLPPQKKSGLGANDLHLQPFEVGFGDKTVTVSKVGIGEVAHVYKLSADGQDYAFKVPNDPARMDVHGTYSETAAFVHLAKGKVSDLIDFHAANPAPTGGWMLTEFVSKPVARQGRPLADVLAEQGLMLGDDWSANRGPGNVAWDLGGIEPIGVARPKSLEQLQGLLSDPVNSVIAGRKLDGIKDQAELKEALLLCLESPSVGGQVARSAVRLLHDPADLNQVLSRALETPGAAGRAAFELDQMSNTPYITALFYKALANPESRVEATKQIDKLPPEERLAAFNAAFVFPEARAMAARSIASIPDAEGRAAAVEKASAYPESNFVQYQLKSRTGSLTREEEAEKQGAFEDYLDRAGLATGSKIGVKADEQYEKWLGDQRRRPSGEQLSEHDLMAVRGIWNSLNGEQRQLPAAQLEDMAAHWRYLNAEQWRSMTARETTEFMQTVQKYHLGLEQSKEVFKKPDIGVWLRSNNPDSVPDLHSIIHIWDQIPHRLRTLDGETLSQMAYLWHRMGPSDWAKIPPASAADVIYTIRALNLYPGSSSTLANSLDFARWYCDTGKNEGGSDNQYVRILNVWDRLTPEQRLEPVGDLKNLALYMESADKLNKIFGDDSPVAPYLASLESADRSPVSLVSQWFLAVQEAAGKKGEPSAAKALVEQLVNDRAPADAFSQKNLSNTLNLETYFGDKPELKQQLIQLLPAQGEMSAMLSFVGGNPKVNPMIVELAVNNGFKGTESDWSALRSIADLASYLKLDQAESHYLYGLQRDGLRLNELATYIRENSDVIPQVRSLIRERAGKEALDARRLADHEIIGKLQAFTDDELDKIEKMQMTGRLSVSRLANHLKDRPGDSEAIKKLLSDGADAVAIDDYMRLSTFPAAVDLKLVQAVKHGDITCEDVIAKLKDWRTGRYFRDLVITHVNHGANLTPVELAKLHTRAGEMAAQEKVVPMGEPDKFQLQAVPEAATFVDALKGIERKIPADKPIVLLGRDAWPLLPMLRLAGRDVQYFLWSRLQNHDAATKAQWLKEIPPGAAVIDTGYSGSIIDNIRSIDPTATGYLMSSNRPDLYPALLSTSDHHTQVGKIENLPKLIYRTQAHNKNGSAISRKSANNLDGDNSYPWLETTRWNAERRARELLSAAGLPQWDVWRYSQFVGLSAKERLGVQTQEDVEQIYKSVRERRERAGAPVT